MNSPKSIVFITGTYLSNNCWTEWQTFFESKGYKCLAPPWPNKEAPAEELRNRYPGSGIASNRLSTLTRHYADIIKVLPGKPILIGHSLGGLILQLLLQDGAAAAAVAIHSFPPQGVNGFKSSFLKASWEAMGLFTSSNKSYLLSFKKWQKIIANGMTCEEQKALYYQYAIPESKIVMREIFKCITKLNFCSPCAPLLFTSGGKDKLVPAAANYDNYKKYKQGDSIISYKSFKTHNHLVFGQPAWREEADFIHCWLKSINK